MVAFFPRRGTRWRKRGWRKREETERERKRERERERGRKRERGREGGGRVGIDIRTEKRGIEHERCIVPFGDVAGQNLHRYLVVAYRSTGRGSRSQLDKAQSKSLLKQSIASCHKHPRREFLLLWTMAISFDEIFRTWTKLYLITSQTSSSSKLKRVSRIHNR